MADTGQVHSFSLIYNAEDPVLRCHNLPVADGTISTAVVARHLRLRRCTGIQMLRVLT